MIPLVRPLIPSLKELEPYYEISRLSNQWSNFGPVWKQAVERLNALSERHCLPVINGTVALELALQVQLDRGSTVVLPDFTHAGTLQAVIRAGMNPILAPVAKDTWTIDIDWMETFEFKWDCMLVVSPFGYRVDFARYDEYVASRGKKVIYDLAGSWGTPFHETANTTCFSLHATKNFSCGEGGLIFFSEFEHWEQARKLTNFDTNLDRTIGSEWAGNLKIDELKAGMICAHLDQPERLKKRIEDKRMLIDYYQNELDAYIVRHDRHVHPYSAPSLCVLSGLPAAKLERLMNEQGFCFRQYYLRLSMMPALGMISSLGRSPNLFDSCIAFPSDVDDDELDQIVTAVRKSL